MEREALLNQLEQAAESGVGRVELRIDRSESVQPLGLAPSSGGGGGQ